MIDVYHGTLDRPELALPALHVHAGEQLAWFEIHDDLPRYAGTDFGTTPDLHGPKRR